MNTTKYAAVRTLIGYFSQVMVASTEDLKHSCYHTDSKVVSTKLVIFVWAGIKVYVVLI